jgi:hypothetical protein
MSPEPVDSEHYRRLLRPVFRDRRFIVIGGPIVALAVLGGALRALGAARPFLLGNLLGTGELPDLDPSEWGVIEVEGENMVERMHAFERAVASPPAEIRGAIDAWDPDRTALAVGPIVLSPLPHVAGRRRYASREASWAALEDKVAIERFWDAAGIRRAPSEIVPPERDALQAAARRLERGAGTVWAGDARDLIHGGAVGTRWVRSSEQAAEAGAFFATRCDRVRVMPFLEGIPCSVHGMVFPDGTAVLRPVEMVTLRRPHDSRLAYAGFDSFWDPPESDREQLRRVARRAGEQLRERVGYRGPFTVDGVLTEQGFLPSELNPRFGAALLMLAGCAPDLPLVPLLLAATEGERLDYRASDLEALLLEAVDRRRGSGGGILVPGRGSGRSERHALCGGPDGFRRAAPDEEPDATLWVGPGDGGRYVRFVPDPERVPIGPSLAPRVAAALAWADATFDLGLGPLEPARPAR